MRTKGIPILINVIIRFGYFYSFLQPLDFQILRFWFFDSRKVNVPSSTFQNYLPEYIHLSRDIR